MRTGLGVAMTTVWLVFWVVVLFVSSTSVLTMSLDAFGNFMAGIFAPLALLWVVLGYYQQGEELNLNTNALISQEFELKNQVGETRALVQATDRNSLLLRDQINNFKGREIKILIAEIDEMVYLSTLNVDQWFFGRIDRNSQNWNDLNDKYMLNVRRITLRLGLVRKFMVDEYPKNLDNAVSTYQRYASEILINGTEYTSEKADILNGLKRKMFDEIEKLSSI